MSIITDEILEEIEEAGLDYEAAIIFAENMGVWDQTAFEDAFIGWFPGYSDHEAVGEYLAETYDYNVPDHLVNYIDWTAMGRDACFSGDIWAEEDPADRRNWALFYNY